MTDLTLIATGHDLPLSALIDAARAADQCGAFDDAMEGYTMALERVRAGEEPRRGPEVMRWVARIHYERGHYDTAQQVLEASLVNAQALGLRHDAASALNSMGNVELLRGRLEVAEVLYTRAGVIAAEENALKLAALVDQNLGVIANIRGDLGTALLRYDAALAHLRELNDDRACALVLMNMGLLRTQVGEYAAAELSFNAAARLAEQMGDEATLAKIDINRAQLYLKRQNYELAREACERAFKGYSRLGAEKGIGEAHMTFGVLYRETGKPQVAHVQLGLALKMARSCENSLLEAETENERALLLLSERKVSQALQSLNRAHKVFCELDARREILDLSRRVDRLETSYMQALDMLADDSSSSRAADSPVSAGRGKRVAELASMLAESVGYNDLIWLRMGAYLHDIGNRAVPAELLDKPGPLSAEEYNIVKTHTVSGDELVTKLEFPEDIRPMVRSHHEHWDGSGYPDGLAREEIPVSARIICIADVYDALTTARSYRAAFSSEEALAIMESEADRIFDPRLFSKFAKQIRLGAARALTNDLQTYRTAI